MTLLAEIALVVDGLVADEAVVVCVMPQSRFSCYLSICSMVQQCLKP